MGVNMPGIVIIDARLVWMNSVGEENERTRVSRILERVSADCGHLMRQQDAFGKVGCVPLRANKPGC